MRIGIEIANQDLQPRASAVAGMARSAERLGYATVWVRAVGSARPATDALWVAAGAAEQIRLGVSTNELRVDELIDQVVGGPLDRRRRLTVAAPADAIERSGAASRRLAEVAGVLVCSVIDGAAGPVVPIQGYFATNAVDDLAAARGAVVTPMALDHPMELVVRVPFPCRAALALVTDDLFALRTSGVDEVVLAAEAAPGVDAAMAAYAALAETLETATRR